MSSLNTPQAAAKDRALASAAMRHRDLQQKIKDMQEELDNSSVVFKMHYQVREMGRACPIWPWLLHVSVLHLACTSGDY